MQKQSFPPKISIRAKEGGVRGNGGALFPFIVNSREFRNRRCHLRCAVERPPARLSHHLEKRGFSHGLLPPVDPPWCRADRVADRSIGPGPEPGEVCDTRQGLVRVPVGCRATGRSRTAVMFHTVSRHEIKGERDGSHTPWPCGQVLYRRLLATGPRKQNQNMGIEFEQQLQAVVGFSLFVSRLEDQL